MKLSVESKFMSEDILNRRRQMIEDENLRINGKITKEIFKDLYSKYGSGLDERDFAWAFLDIDELRYYNIEKGKTLEPLVLIYEYVSDEEFKALRDKLIEEYDLKHGDKIPYEQVLAMYEKFGGRLSINLFLEEVLGIKSTTLKSFKKGETKNAKINFDAEPGQFYVFHNKKQEVPMYVLNPEYIHELRKRLISEAGLRVGGSVSYAQIETLNKEFCPDMPTMLFAQKAIDIKTNSYNGLKNHKSSNPINGGVLQDIVVPDEYIKKLQDKIVMLHKLEACQLLKKEEFDKLYDEYGGVLSKRSFGIQILDMTVKGYNDLAEGDENKSVTILNSRKKTDFDSLRERIIRANKLHYGDMIKYDQFKEIHQMYAPNISEFVFAEKIFGISSPSFQSIKYGGGRARIYLKLPTPEELMELQKKVIIENGIHINDKINYEKLEKLYAIYGGIMPIRMFAIEVLALDKQSFLRIKNHPEKEALALFNLEIPDTEIEKLKEKIIFENSLQIPRELTLAEIEELYATYGGIMSKQMFARRILGVSQSSFDNLRYKKNDATIVCIRGDFDKDEIKRLKVYLAEGLTDAKIAARLGVTVTVLRINMNKLIETDQLADTNMTYEKVKLLKNNGKTPEEIVDALELSIEEVKEMLNRYKKECAQEEEDRKKQKKQKKAENKEEKRKFDIEKGAIKAIDDYEYKPSSIKKVRAYIEECKRDFENGTFPREKMDFLMECMIFVQCDCREIELFSKMCIHFNEYNRASAFIGENMDNEGVTPEERKKLTKLRDTVKYAIRKENALRLIKIGGMTPAEIAHETGILEVDVIKLRRALEERKVSLIGNKKPQSDART